MEVSSGEHGLKPNAAPYPDACRLICPPPNKAMTAQGKPAVGSASAFPLHGRPREGGNLTRRSFTRDAGPLSAYARERGQPVRDPRLRGDERAMLNLAA